MKKAQLGQTDAWISCMGLGTMYFGTKVDEQTSFKLLDIYFEAGGRFIDTGNKYASWVSGFKGGESETLIGKWMNARGNREDLFLASKVGFAYQNVPQSLRPEYIISECEKSLKRHTVRDWVPFCCLQQKYTLLQPAVGAYFGTQMVLTPDLTDYCKENQITLMGYSPLLGGTYSAKGKDLPEQYKNNDNLKRFATLQDIASETGFSLNQIVLAWMVQQNPSVLPLITGSNEQQLLENIGAANIILETGQMTRLNNVLVQEIKYF